MNKALGQVIRERRDELDMSLREFAKKLNCSAPFISDVELGRRFPSEEMLTQMARILKLELKELVEADPRPPLDGIKDVTEENPEWAYAFRRVLDGDVTPEDLVKLAKQKAKRKD